MPQGMEEQYQTTNQNLVPTANNLVQHRPVNLPQVQGQGGQLQGFANQVTNLPAFLGPGEQNAANPVANRPANMWGSNMGAMQGLNRGNMGMVNPQLPIVQQVDPATGQPVPYTGAQPNPRGAALPNANDIINTVQPVPTPQPRPQIPSDIAQMMSGIANYFNQNPAAASAVFGQGGLASFQQRIGQLFQPPSTQQLPNYANSLAGQVAGQGRGSVIQGLKNLFTQRQA